MKTGILKKKKKEKSRVRNTAINVDLPYIETLTW